MGAGIVPVGLKNGELVFLFGKENRLRKKILEWKKWVTFLPDEFQKKINV